jgi:hypothetical protein
MTRDLPDELLSAYLDGEVSAEERAAVEAHLAESEADRQLLEELRCLRNDMAVLPRAAASTNFADRVVQAALSAAAESKAVQPVSRRQRRNLLVAAAAAIALAACLFIAFRFWGPAAIPVADSPDAPRNPLIAALHSAIPGEGQAVVLRLRLPQGVSLEEALVAAGLGLKAADANTGAVEFGAAYRAELAKKLGSDAALAEATVAAAEAMFVESPLAHLERVLTALASDPARPCELLTEARLAFASPKPRDNAVGEAGPSIAQGPAPGQPYLQHLPPSLFRLEKQKSPVAVGPVPAKVNGQQLVRVLILVERME